MYIDRATHMNRRRFLQAGSAGLAALGFSPSLPALHTSSKQSSLAWKLVAATDQQRILHAAQAALAQHPVTVVDVPSPKSPGDRYDYFSEADYFWPNPKNPNGPYINRDGQSNPSNFNGHRQAMVRLSLLVPQLTAAWLLTQDDRYASAAWKHLTAWFVAPSSRMAPHLEYAQGVHGVSTGRSYGIIDTLHLVEVARSVTLLTEVAPSEQDRDGVTAWFRSYLAWMTDSDKGRTERGARNNHATCWALQAAEFARVTQNADLRQEIAHWYKTQLLEVQMGEDGSFPQELARTKPYSYSIFNFDITGSLAQSLTSADASMTTFALPDGRGLCKAAEWIFPYLKDKSTWPYRKDVEHFDALPARSPGLLFAGLACQQASYLALWKTLQPDPTDREILRNFPVRQPLLWV